MLECYTINLGRTHNVKSMDGFGDIKTLDYEAKFIQS